MEWRERNVGDVGVLIEFGGICGVQRMERVERAMPSVAFEFCGICGVLENGARWREWKKPGVVGVVLHALRHKLSDCKHETCCR